MGLEVQYDVVIIGAGPHALSLLTRLLVDVKDKYEERPNNQSLFSRNDEGKLQAKIKDNPQMQRTPRQIKSFLQSKQKENNLLNNVCVIDIHGCWLAQWAKQFDILGISHLRSTSSIHPDAFDLQSLMAFAKMQKRESEMLDISRSIRGSKFTGPFIIPSTKLFWDFCNQIVHNYCLDKCVKQGKVVNLLKQEHVGIGTVYEVLLTTGETVKTKQVVIATGNTTKNIPCWAEDICAAYTGRTFRHSADLINQSMVNGITASSSPGKYATNGNSSFINDGDSVVIIGGGLSSGHLAIKAAMMGASHVYLVCRSFLKVRQFDLCLEWIGRSRFIKLAQYFSISNHQERFKILTDARNGGSVTPFVHEQLLKLVDEGLLDIFEQTDVWSCEKDFDGKWFVELSNGNSVLADNIILATGSVVDSKEDPLLRKLHKMYDVDTIGGLPVLTEDLEWCENSGVFVMGPYAALQLGPDALNVAGARGGASRIAYKLKKSLGIS